MKKQKNEFQFKKKSIVELNEDTLNSVIGGTLTIKECFLCINSSNGANGDIFKDVLKS